MLNNRVNSVKHSKESIPSQASKEEGVTTMAKASTPKWAEVRGIRKDDEIVCSCKRLQAAERRVKINDLHGTYRYGKHRLVMNRFMRPETVLCLQMDKWALATLRPMKSEELAKTGDGTKHQVIMEATLVCRNPNASAKVSDCTTA